MVIMVDLNEELEWTTTNMSLIQHVPKVGYDLHLV
jgi:hypothetical protein